MKRRAFIFSPLLIFMGDVFANQQSPMLGNNVNYLELLTTGQNRSTAALMGRDFLAVDPAHKNETRLKKAVGITDSEGFNRSSFETKVSTDFAQGNIECVEGWVLSKAELSLCALIYLQTSQN